MDHFVYQPTVIRTHPRFVATQNGDMVSLSGAGVQGYSRGTTLDEIAANPRHMLTAQLPALRAAGAVAVIMGTVDGKPMTFTFSAAEWALGADERARYAAFAAARGAAEGERQQQERAFDSANNEGGEGYNPHRSGAARTYGRR